MNKFLKQFGAGTIMALALFGSKIVFAGERGGNGGDAIVCPNRVYMLDTYELEKQDKTANLSELGPTLEVQVEAALQRIARTDGHISRELKKIADEILNDYRQFLVDGKRIQSLTEFTYDGLVNIADEGSATIPQGCKIEQLIIQNLKPLPSQKKFTVQIDLWERMSNTEKAVGILHEAIYGYLLANGVNNSLSTRYFNGLVIADELHYFTDREYLNFLADFDFPRSRVEMRGFNINPKDADFDEYFDLNGNIIGAREGITTIDRAIPSLKSLQAICLSGSKMWSVREEWSCSKAKGILQGQVITFSWVKQNRWPGDKIFTDNFTSIEPFTINGYKVEANQPFHLSSDFTYISKIFYVNKVRLGTKDYNIARFFPSTPYAAAHIELFPNMSAKLLEVTSRGNGNVQSSGKCTSLSFYRMTLPSGKKIRFQKKCGQARLSFDENGNLIKKVIRRL